ncbi:MAG: mrdA [Gammaproteobacteria bacterium]|jgi:penicillin-binding protein 2|nr:mrdA [Gammaproteobacteria bacterium]
MAKRIILKDLNQELRLFQRRILIVGFLLLLGVLLIIARLCILQWFQHERYTTLSNENQLTIIPIPPNRGLIYDRNGVLLAENLPVFSLELIPDKVANLQKTLRELREFIQISDNDVAQFQKQIKQQRRFEKVALKSQLTSQEVAQFYVNQYRFPGVLINAELLRYYPLGEVMVSALGYVGRINTADLQTLDISNYSGTNYIGKLGIEKSYENILHGQVGNEQVETDASGRIIRIMNRSSPVPGNNLYLTIDSQLQMAAVAALGDHRGAVVAIEPATGQVLALVSQPAYDPNLFVTGISQKDFDALNKSLDQPLFNRAIRGQYPPGSIVKPFYALTALNQNLISTEWHVYDKGWFMLPNSTHRYRGYKKEGLGSVNVRQAIAQSSDIFFYELSRKIGIEGMSNILNAFGFGKDTGIELREELPGLVPTPAWKRANKGSAWYPGDTIITGIGQGFLLVTPLQMASAVAALSMRGNRYHPYLLLKQETSRLTEYNKLLKPETKVNASAIAWETVIGGMEDVISSPQGTGYRFGKPPYSVAAKTGTAQVFSIKQNENYKDLKIPERLRDHSTFIAFAPVEDPKIAIAVIVENSPDAAKVARKVIDTYLLSTTPLPLTV